MRIRMYLGIVLLILSACTITLRKYKKAHYELCKCSVEDNNDNDCDEELEEFNAVHLAMDSRLLRVKEDNPKAYKRLLRKVEQANREIKKLHCGW